MRQGHNPPVMFVLDDGIGFVAKWVEHIPNIGALAVRVISDNNLHPECVPTAD
jgi:hypothetical protein